MRYSASEKLEIIRLVEQSHLPVRRTLGQIGIPRSTFYRWYDQYQTGGPEALDDRSPRPDRVWNRIPDDVRSRVVTLALDEPELVEHSRALCAELGVDWFVNVQFLDGRLLEINPRISTIVYQEDFNMPYLAVKLALGELSEEELRAQQSRVRMTRRAIRYYDQIEYDEP